MSHRFQTSSWRNRLHSTKNSIDFCLRNFFSWQSGVYQDHTKSGPVIVDQPAGFHDALQGLKHTGYSLSAVQERLPEHRYREALAYLQWLDYAAENVPECFELLAHGSEPFHHWVDVGAKNWSYVEAFPLFIHHRILNQQSATPYQLTGIEVDAHRRYTNLKTRGQAAQTFVKAIPQARYISGDFLDWYGQADVISHFLPFVFEDPLLSWGLPLHLFKPVQLLAHGLKQLKPTGLMVIVNQGEDEYLQQRQLLDMVQDDIQIAAYPLGQLPSDFIEYRYPRFGWLVQRL